MYQIILVIHSFIAIALIGFVLIQHGKGAQIGAAFGSGASQTVFGSQGTGSFLMKITAILAAGFFTTSVTLSYIAASRSASQNSVIPVTQRITEVPVAPPVDVPAPAPTTPVDSNTPKS